MEMPSTPPPRSRFTDQDAAGLLVLPYVFGAELWPNSIRSFGSALSQAFHWLFFFAVLRATPSILSSMHQWGAFIFFAGWCFLSLLYVYFGVPETSGLPIEQLDELFEGPWWKAYASAKSQRMRLITAEQQASDVESVLANSPAQPKMTKPNQE